MTTKSKPSSKLAGYSTKCADCVRVEKYRNQDPSRDRFCSRHQCPVEDAPGITCSTRKKGSALRCTHHYAPPCNMEGCNNDCFAYSYHCEIHSCSLRGCQNDARPGLGRDFCDDHKCADRDCQQVRKRIEIDRVLKMAQFCRKHECQTSNCISKKYPGKGYCVAHCCNIDGCPDSRQGGQLGPLCLPHYNESIKKGAFAEIQRQERIRQERAEQLRKTEMASRARAEEQRRRELEARALAEEQRRRDQGAGTRDQYRSFAPKTGETSFFSESEAGYDRFNPRRQTSTRETGFETPLPPRRQTSTREPGFAPPIGRQRFERDTPPLRREDAYIHSDYEQEYEYENDSAYKSGGTADGYGSKRSSGISFENVERERGREPVYGFEQKESTRPRRERDYTTPGARRETWEDVRGW